MYRRSIDAITQDDGTVRVPAGAVANARDTAVARTNARDTAVARPGIRTPLGVGGVP
ncbi:MAG: hypothetical protein ABEJ61_00215 [Haloferacaceae archaeon]